MKLSAFEAADYICVQYGNGGITSAVEAARRAEPTTLTFPETDRKRKKERKKEKKRKKQPASKEIKMQKGKNEKLNGEISKT